MITLKRIELVDAELGRVAYADRCHFRTEQPTWLDPYGGTFTPEQQQEMTRFASEGQPGPWSCGDIAAHHLYVRVVW